MGTIPFEKLGVTVKVESLQMTSVRGLGVVTEGVGFTVTVKVKGVPIQPADDVGVIV